MTENDFKKMAKENLRRYKEWENSPEGVHYNTDIRDCVLPHGATPPEYLIIKVLMKLPRAIREKVQGNATFMVTYGDSTVHHGSAKWVILLNFKLRESNTSKCLTIAHEIGHLMQYIKNRYSTGGREAEKKADDFAEKYGFGRVYSEKQLKEFLATGRGAGGARG